MFALLSLLAYSLFAVDFRTDVWPALERANCVGCHNDNGVASPTRLRFPEGTPSPAVIEAFGKSMHVLVNRAEPGKSLLLAKPTNAVKHAGGARLVPGSNEAKRLRAWVDYLAATPVEQLNLKVIAEKAEPVPPILRRLTHSQYNNTVRDLLNDTSRLADQFPPEDFVGGFRNQYLSQSTSPLLAEAYAAAAEKLARKAFLGGDPHGLVPCKPASFADVACRDKFLKTFGRRAFRRPLQAAELARYQKLFAAEAMASKQFLAGAQVVVEVMLQSPNFLMRSENGLDPSLRPYEVASYLSYFLTNTMPDEALLNAAAAGELGSTEGFRKQARRLLASPKARESVDEFIAEWLRFDRLSGTVRERRLYPQFSPELTLAMTEETRRLAADLIWNNRNFMEFYSSTSTFVNSDLAKLYGVPAPKNEYERVELPATSGRGGVLGQAAFLTMTSKPAETSITARGLFVREQLMCQEVPQPPPGVDANLPVVTRAKPLTQRERLGVHLSNPGCASCHTLIDPIGYSMEKFDAIGGYREKMKLTIFPQRFEKEEEPTTVELDLDTTGTLAGIENATFSTPRELGKILAATPQCQQCVAKQLFRYMAGRHERPSDRVVIDRAFQVFRKSGFQFQELMVALAEFSVHRPEEVN